ncbi:MAG: hypothetical protein GYB31_05780 [Bacteroidetes bacterium]|nr:hypothetical protein [Bacteroidota bacterium]
MRHLLGNGHQITFVGKAWSKIDAEWVYFSSVLDIDLLKETFDKKDKLEYHENRDPKSGQEMGLVDKETGEAVMGTLKV